MCSLHASLNTRFPPKCNIHNVAGKEFTWLLDKILELLINIKFCGVILQGMQIAGLVARDGNICIWPIIDGSVGEITMERVSGPVKAVSAAAIESTAMVFIGTESGAIYCVRTTDGSSATISKLGQGPPSSQVQSPSLI